MIKKFGEYINEGIRDKMTPKSEEDIKRSLVGLDPYVKMRKAIEYGVLSVVKDIIESGIDLKKNLGGGTPAGYYFATDAIKYGKLDIMKYLLENACDINNMENFYLAEAIEKGHYDIAKFLVDELGANVSDEEGDLYLEMAVDHNNLELVKLVLDMGCEYFENDWMNDTILSDKINPEIIKYMMANIPDVKFFVVKMHNDYKRGVEITGKYV